jgi:hypothetical protein
MAEKRVGGHVIRNGRWVPAELAEAETPALSMSNKKDELVAAAEAAGLEVDETMTKAEILEALDGAE